MIVGQSLDRIYSYAILPFDEERVDSGKPLLIGTFVGRGWSLYGQPLFFCPFHHPLERSLWVCGLRIQSGAVRRFREGGDFCMSYLAGVKSELEDVFIDAFERAWKEVMEPALKQSYKNGVKAGTQGTERPDDDSGGQRGRKRRWSKRARESTSASGED